jgi:hypothetical protein
MKNLIKVDPKIFSYEEDFFPLYDGLKPSSMGLLPFSKHKKRFLINEKSFKMFRKNKELCRKERLSKYYRHTSKKYPEIVKFIIQTLLKEYPEYFQSKFANNVLTLQCKLTEEELKFDLEGNLVDYKSKLKFVDAMDALAMQVPEDLVVHDFGKNGRDFASSIHLCACNGWSAEEAIGRGFDHIHKGVKGIKRIIPNTLKMMVFIATKLISFERLAAISFKTTSYLNRHPDFEHIYDKPFRSKMHIRLERQTVTGFSGATNAFLFTIRTFVYDVFDKSRLRREAVSKVFENPPEKSYAYEVIMKHRDKVLKKLK